MEQPYSITWMTSSWLILQNNLSVRSTMFWVCERMGVPVAKEKSEGPSTCITFLGIVLDSSLLQLRLPPEKCEGPSTCITFLDIVLDFSLLQLRLPPEKCEGPSTCITFLGIVLDSSLLQLRLPPEKCEGPSTCITFLGIVLDFSLLQLRLPPEKCEGPSTCITFLDIVLDFSLLQLRLPPEKLQEISSLTRSWLGIRKVTKRELLSLFGKLSFAAKLAPSRMPVPMTPHPILNHSEKAPSPHPS